MEKGLKRIKTIAIVLMIIIVSVIAFCGLYLNNNGVWKNVVPGYKKGMDFAGFRELKFVLDTAEEEKEVYVDENGNYCGTVDVKEAQSTQSQNLNISLEPTENQSDSEENVEVQPTTSEKVKIMEERVASYKKETRTVKANEDKDISIDNFEKTKSIIQKRLSNINPYEYNIRQDSVTGELVLEVPDDSETLEMAKALVSTKGLITIRDTQNGLILLDSTHVTKANPVTNQGSDGHYGLYIQLTFDKEGRDIIKTISNQYQTITNAADNSETTYYITVALDDTDLVTTYFGEELSSGVLTIPLGTEYETFEDLSKAAKSAQEISNVIESGILPINYSLASDVFVNTTINDQVVFVARVIFAFAILLVSVYFIIRFKGYGFLYAIYSIGYIACMSLICRYTNVVITMNSGIAFICSAILNYVFVNMLLNKVFNNQKVPVWDVFKQTMKEYYLMIVPVCVIMLIFTFMTSLIISSVGQVLFWGIVIQAVYNTFLVII